ncbi:hypothetical protein B0H16DRAFT_1426180 [Mycena metata]|uniref:Transposase n=1 Tax=Mycena metata TaxID=1033252 RepID=A0AAD7MXG7_9AGAR|nr:hypothetical protein B0H16DRAFT_1426180 [Mycena metata]
MPRKTKTVPARQHYTKDLKERVIYQNFILGKQPTAISIDLDMPLRVVQRCITTWKEIGEVCHDRKYKGRAPLLSTQHTKTKPNFDSLCLALIKHSPDIYLDEIQDQLYNCHEVDASLATISRTLHRLAITSKKVRPLASQQSSAGTLCVISSWIGDEPADRIVCADESAVNILTSYRHNGWSLKDLRSRKRCCFIRGTR